HHQERGKTERGEGNRRHHHDPGKVGRRAPAASCNVGSQWDRAGNTRIFGMAASVAPFEDGSNPAVLTQVTRRMQDGVPHFPERRPGMSLVDDAEGQGSAPLVWRHYHQATLDAAYDQSHYAPNQA